MSFAPQPFSLLSLIIPRKTTTKKKKYEKKRNWLRYGCCWCLFPSVGIHIGVNFTNILRAAFLYESLLSSFLYLWLRFVFFWQKEIGENTSHKMLVKLTPGNLQVSDVTRKPSFKAWYGLILCKFNCYLWFSLNFWPMDIKTVKNKVDFYDDFLRHLCQQYDSTYLLSTIFRIFYFVKKMN